MSLKLYFDINKLWIGYCRDYSYHTICLIPTIVIRWDRKKKVEQFKSQDFSAMPIIETTAVPENKVYFINPDILDPYKNPIIQYEFPTSNDIINRYLSYIDNKYLF